MRRLYNKANVMMKTPFVVGAGLRGSDVRIWTKPLSTPDEICSAIRNCTILHYEDIETILACFASMVQTSSALTEKCTRLVVDGLDEIVGQVQNDKFAHQAEAMWMTQHEGTSV